MGKNLSKSDEYNFTSIRQTDKEQQSQPSKSYTKSKREINSPSTEYAGDTVSSCDKTECNSVKTSLSKDSGYSGSTDVTLGSDAQYNATLSTTLTEGNHFLHSHQMRRLDLLNKLIILGTIH